MKPNLNSQNEVIVSPTPVSVKCILDHGFIKRKREEFGATHYEFQFRQPYSVRNLSFPVIKYDEEELPERAVASVFKEPRKYWSVSKGKEINSTRLIVKLEKPKVPIVKPKYVLALIAIEGKNTFKSGKWIENEFLTEGEPLFKATATNVSRTGAHWLDIAIIIAPKVIVNSRGNTPWAKGEIVLTP